MLIKDKKGAVIKVLSTIEVIELHELLSTHPQIIGLTERIFPTGVKNMHLLESAVSRQYVGFGEDSKYNSVYSSCATLVFGIAFNHAFHNGNKRAALLSMIKHLYRNGLVLPSALDPDDLYYFLTCLVDRSIKKYVNRYKQYERFYRSVYGKRRKYHEPSDQHVKFIEGWLKKNTVPYSESGRPVDWTTLLNKLANMGLKSKYNFAKQEISIQRTEARFFSLLTKTYEKTYSFEGTQCPLSTVGKIRRDFDLTTAHGFDISAFHTEKTFLNEEIILFKQVIYRLSDG